jgi:hypothetical protein
MEVPCSGRSGEISRGLTVEVPPTTAEEQARAKKEAEENTSYFGFIGRRVSDTAYFSFIGRQTCKDAVVTAPDGALASETPTELFVHAGAADGASFAANACAGKAVGSSSAKAARSAAAASAAGTSRAAAKGAKVAGEAYRADDPADAQRQAVWKTLKNTKPPPTVAPQTAVNTAPAADEPQGMVDKIM